MYALNRDACEPMATNPSFMNGVPELLILRALESGEMYGYELVQAIQRAPIRRSRSARAWSIPRCTRWKATAC